MEGTDLPLEACDLSKVPVECGAVLLRPGGRHRRLRLRLPRGALRLVHELVHAPPQLRVRRLQPRRLLLRRGCLLVPLPLLGHMVKSSLTAVPKKMVRPRKKSTNAAPRRSWSPDHQIMVPYMAPHRKLMYCHAPCQQFGFDFNSKPGMAKGSSTRAPARSGACARWPAPGWHPAALAAAVPGAGPPAASSPLRAQQ